MKKKIIPIVCFLLTLVLCVAAYATVSSVRHREKTTLTIQKGITSMK